MYWLRSATIIRDNVDELSDILLKEQSKIAGLAGVEVSVVADYFDYHAGLAYSFEGEILQSDTPGENIYLHYLQIGVSVGICPWNFPVFVWARKVAPALLAGCSVVVKSSVSCCNYVLCSYTRVLIPLLRAQQELTPLTVFKIMSYVSAAIGAGKCDLPPGVISVVTGYGATIGDALTKSPIPGIISMTGSVATGQRIMSNAAANMTKVSLELGGKAPCIVMDDAKLDIAVDSIVASRVIFSGQVCNCAERVYVHEAVYDQFLTKFVAKMQAAKFGDPSEEGVEYGALISKDHLNKVQGMVDRAVEAGATLLCGVGSPM